MNRRIVSLSLAAVAAMGMVACSSEADNNGGSADSFTIGVTEGNTKQWETFTQLAKDQGINVKLVDYQDYVTPNKALSEGADNANSFQHLKFLAAYNVANNTDLVPVGATKIVPLALYWKDHSNLDGIEGEEVAIPNDTTNQGRAINVLVQAGLVTLKDGKEIITPTPADIDPDKSKVTVAQFEATQTTAAYGEGKPAIINNNFLDRANIDPQSAVFTDDPNSAQAEPYINVFATRADNKDNETLKKLTEIWQDPQVTAAMAEDSRGTSVPVNKTPAQLQEILERLEADERNAG